MLYVLYSILSRDKDLTHWMSNADLYWTILGVRATKLAVLHDFVFRAKLYKLCWSKFFPDCFKMCNFTKALELQCWRRTHHNNNYSCGFYVRKKNYVPSRLPDTAAGKPRPLLRHRCDITSYENFPGSTVSILTYQ